MPKPSMKKSVDALRVAHSALAMAKQMRREPERKYFVLSSSTTNYLAGISTALFSVAQGAGGAQRVGDKLRALRMRLRGKFYSLVPSDTTFRVALVRSRGGGVPAVTDVWNTDDTQSLRNRSLDDIYTVVKEQTVTLNASFLNGDVSGQLDWDIPLDHDIFYTSAATTYERNGLYLVVTNDVADSASAVDKPAIGDTGSIWRAELTFTDE
jgi:hypothetical protein